MTVECKYVTLLKKDEVEIQFEYDNHELTFVVHVGKDTVKTLFEEIQRNYHILFGVEPTKKVLDEWNAVLKRYIPKKVGRFIVYYR